MPEDVSKTQWKAGSAEDAALGWTVERPSFFSARGVSHGHVRELLDRRSVVFFGDSLTRHQFYSLVHFLSTGQWVRPVSPVASEKGYTGIGKLLYELQEVVLRDATLSLRECVASTDAQEGASTMRHWWVRNCSESKAKSAGTLLTYYTWTAPGDVVMQRPSGSGRGICMEVPFFDAMRSPAVPSAQCAAFRTCMVKRKRDGASGCAEEDAVVLPAPEAVAWILETLQPDVLVLNTGFWDTPEPPELVTRALAEAVHRAIVARKAAGRPLRVIWKATTVAAQRYRIISPCNQKGIIRALLKAGAEYFDAYALLLGLRGNRTLERAAYYDDKHFGPAAHAELNAALLWQLEQGWRLDGEEELSAADRKFLLAALHADPTSTC